MTMPADDDQVFARLVQRASDGSQQAAQELVQTYSRCILRTVRRTLNTQMRGKFDSDDFVQAVWASFFATPSKWADLQQPQQLIGLLRRMVRNKVVDEHRRRMATQKYRVQRELPLQLLDGAERNWLRSHDPSPSQWAMANERWRGLLRGHGPRHRAIVRLKLRGMTNRSVAERLGISEKTVQRVLQQMVRDADK